MTSKNTNNTELSLDISKNLATSLKVACADAGTNLNDVCREAGVHRSTVQRWVAQEPKTYVEIRKILQAINKRRRENKK